MSRGPAVPGSVAEDPETQSPEVGTVGTDLTDLRGLRGQLGGRSTPRGNESRGVGRDLYGVLGDDRVTDLWKRK